MKPPPSPRPSPRPPGRSSYYVGDDIDDEPITTGVYPATREYTRHIAWLSVAKALGVTIVGIIAASIAGWRTVIAEAKAASEPGVESVRMQAASTQRELERFQTEVEKRMERGDAQGDRMEKKFDVLLDRLNVRNPAPAPKDGGT